PIDLATLEAALRFYETQPWRTIDQGATDPEMRRLRQLRQEAARADLFRAVFRAFVRVVGVARDERLEQVRGAWPKLPAACVTGVDLLSAPFDEALTAVQQTALANRLDLMNARAQLVDSWRQIAVRANALLGAASV